MPTNAGQTGWRHDDYKVQREFERVGRMATSKQEGSSLVIQSGSNPSSQGNKPEQTIPISSYCFTTKHNGIVVQKPKVIEAFNFVDQGTNSDIRFPIKFEINNTLLEQELCSDTNNEYMQSVIKAFANVPESFVSNILIEAENDACEIHKTRLVEGDFPEGNIDGYPIVSVDPDDGSSYQSYNDMIVTGANVVKRVSYYTFLNTDSVLDIANMKAVPVRFSLGKREDLTRNFLDARLENEVIVNAQAYIPKTAEGFTYTQTIASDHWIVNHNLGRIPATSIVNLANNVMYATIHHIDNNNLEIFFSIALTGMVICS